MGSYLDSFKKKYKDMVRVPAYDTCNNALLQKKISNNLIEFLNDQDVGITLYQAIVNMDGSLSWGILNKIN